MTCCARGGQNFRAARAAQSRTESSVAELTGTWDFKWPLGTTIRVAFQRLPAGTGVSEEAFEFAKEKVKEYAMRWNLPKDKLSFDFNTRDLEPPLGAQSADESHRSPFVATDPRTNPYDVLISLAPLPIERVDRFRPESDRVERVVYPLSELGSYSRRADYGAPTVFIGPFGHQWPKGGPSEPDNAFRSYVASKLGQHIIVHELGHVLGLPHSHQSPKLLGEGCARSDFYRPPSELKEFMFKVFGVNVDDGVLAEHLLRPWAGSESYSDWAPFKQEVLTEHETTGRLASVMSLPLYEFMTQRGEIKTSPVNVEDSSIIFEPTAHDRETLSLMYGD